jgi:hypothetical protein
MRLGRRIAAHSGLDIAPRVLVWNFVEYFAKRPMCPWVLAVDCDMALIIIRVRIERCAGLVKLAQCAKGRYAEAPAKIVFTMQDVVAKHDCMSMHGDCFEAEILHERLQGIEANLGVVIKLRDPSLVDCRNGVETLGQNLPAEPRRGLKKCDVKKPGRKPFEQMGHHQPTRTASDDCQLNHAPTQEPNATSSKNEMPSPYNTG